MEPVKRKLYIVIAVLFAVVLIIAAGSMAYDAIRKSGWAKQTASQMVLQDTGLSGNWTRTPYNMDNGRGGTIDRDGSIFWRNVTSGSDSVILLNIYGYDSLSRASAEYSYVVHYYDLRTYVRDLDIGKNSSLWEMNDFSLMVDHKLVNFTNAYYIVFLKANYVCTVQAAYNDNTTFNPDNAVQLAREQAALIY